MRAHGFRFAPKSGHCATQSACRLCATFGSAETLFDNLVSADEQCGRHGETERLGRLHVDHQFEFGRLLNRQIGRLGAFENFIDVVACTAEQIGYIGAVDDQSARGEFSDEIDRRQMMVCREQD